MESPFACDMNALTSEQRIRHGNLAAQLIPAVVEYKELPDGYAARFQPGSELILTIAEFVMLERLCCPFFELELKIEKERGPLWLKITGREGVKPFIQAEFGI